MKMALVYESMFGNTEELAAAVAVGLRGRGAEVVVIRAGDLGDHDLGSIELLVLAAPTHALSLSRVSTRADAVARGADEQDASNGMREWIRAAADATERPPVAVFDSRARSARHWPGAASRTMRRALRRGGFTVVDRTSFYVEGVTGPLLEGEVAKAQEWGYGLAGLVTD